MNTVHERLIKGVACASFLALGQQRALAQTLLLGIDAGQRVDTHQNGVTNTSYFGGFSMSAILAGFAGKKSAIVVPITAELRYSSKSYVDANLFADVGVRVGNVTFGGGGAFSWDNSPDIADPGVGGASGHVIVLYPMSFGYSAFAKLNTGPQGRMFLQGRYTRFPASLSYQYKTAANQEFYSENGLANEDVPALDNSTIRVAAGYVLSGRTIVRAQYTIESWRYQRVFDNSAGAYDRDSRIYSLGLSWIL
jgi:hypothetical protein